MSETYFERSQAPVDYAFNDKGCNMHAGFEKEEFLFKKEN